MRQPNSTRNHFACAPRWAIAFLIFTGLSSNFFADFTHFSDFADSSRISEISDFSVFGRSISKVVHPSGLFARSLEEDSYKWNKVGGTWFKVPSGFKIKKPQIKVFHHREFSLRLSSHSFQLGNVVFVELTPADPADLSQKNWNRWQVSFLEKRVPLSQSTDQLFGYLGIPADSKQANIPIQVTFRKNGQKKKTVSFSIPIKKKSFGSTRFSIRISDRKTPKAVLKKIAKDRKLKKRVFKRSSAKSYLTNEFALPRNIFHITSPFWQKRQIRYYRIVNKKKKFNKEIRKKIHRGVDLRGFPGHPVYALARGKVVLAKHMHYEGKFIVLDHGQNIFSGYMHLNKLSIYVGKVVRAGEKIGEAGNTGAITGPHLHLFLRVNNIYTDPLSIFGLPITTKKNVKEPNT